MLDENKTTDTVEVQNAVEQTAPLAATAAPQNCTAESSESQADERRVAPQTKAEVLQRLQEIIDEGGNTIRRQDLESLKQTYYRLHTAALKTACDEFVKNGGLVDDFQPAPDADEEILKERYERIKTMRAEAAAKEEKEKQDNLKRKQEIIETIKAAAISPEEADKQFENVKKLQAEWKEIKKVPVENVTELWKTYQLYCEQFYDQLHLNYEARQYAFKKNLESKIEICEKAERLSENPDVITAFHGLQNLHQEFREIGPVNKEQREEIWNRFKAASTIINKRYQDHFTQIKAQEEENLQKKIALCEKVETLHLESLNTNAAWEKQTEEVLALQTEWRTIGFTPRKDNAKVFERFRVGCDRFFQYKSEFFKQQRETFAANLEKKTALAEQAEALKESTDWIPTTNKLVALQKEWKTIGPVAHKFSDEIWTRFNEACNYFFDRRTEATGDQRKEEQENLDKKNNIIAQLEKLYEEKGDDLRQRVQTLQDEWNTIGHVPFRKKEDIYKRYRQICDKIFDDLHIAFRRRNVDNFRKKVSEKAGSELERELQRLRNIFETKSNEIKNYDTNLSFFNATSSKGNSIVTDIEKKIERLKGDLEEISQKIQAVRQQIKAEREAKKAAQADETPAE